MNAIAAVMARRRFVAGCIAGAVLIRIAWILLIHPAPTSDSRFYYETAVSLSNGGGYVDDGGPTAWRPPGYSGFLAMLFRVFWPSGSVAAAGNVALYGLVLVACGPDRDLLHGGAVEAVLGEHFARDQQELSTAGLGGQAFGRQDASPLMPHLTRDASGLNITG